MLALTGAVLGVLVACSASLVASGWRGVAVRPAGRARVVPWNQVSWRAGSVVGPFVLVTWATGWPAAGALVGVAAGIAPSLIGARRRRDETTQRSEALAAWAEMLRDTIASHAGLQEALAVTARVAPEPVRADVQALAARAERGDLVAALRRFATDVADPVADLIVASLTIAADRQAQRLADLLSQIAATAREQSAMRLRVETGRARTYASSKALVVISFGLAVALMTLSPTFMEPFDTVTGQVVLLVIGALFAGALWGLVQLGRPAVSPRLLVGLGRNLPDSGEAGR